MAIATEEVTFWATPEEDRNSFEHLLVELQQTQHCVEIRVNATDQPLLLIHPFKLQELIRDALAFRRTNG